jgi:phosphatidylinositol-3,4,5-trisphosphate 3-phosphatase/dual-specificity protein phosphatase PTEN
MSQEEHSESTDVGHIYFPKCIKHDYTLQYRILNNLLTEEDQKKLRKMVSMKKRRFQNDLFDLDLSYVTNRIIAFAYPSYDYERSYRNTLESVFQFFEMYHRGKYRLFNLCCELKSYHLVCEGLCDKVITDFGFLDHHPPPLERIYPFCKAVDEWLSISDDHVVGVNCKARKGRTGLMICCYLLWNGACSSAQEAIHIFNQLRTENGVGINLPSQHRYIDYFNQCCSMSKLPNRMQIIEIETIVVSCCLSITEPIAYLQIEQLPNVTMENGLEKMYVWSRILHHYGGIYNL